MAAAAAAACHRWTRCLPRSVRSSAAARSASSSLEWAATESKVRPSSLPVAARSWRRTRVAAPSGECLGQYWRRASPRPFFHRKRSPAGSLRVPRSRRVQISDSSSRILAGLLEARTGQQLTMSRRWRIETALSALLRERGIATLDELITILVMGKEPSLSQKVVEALLNNETYFFRDRAPFDVLQRHALTELAQKRAKSKRLRIWSAGCSTGQEVYSLSMLFAEEP